MADELHKLARINKPLEERQVMALELIADYLIKLEGHAFQISRNMVLDAKSKRSPYG